MILVKFAFLTFIYLCFSFVLWSVNWVPIFPVARLIFLGFALMIITMRVD
jgi:integral membrane sensor domain MASE1